MEATAEDGNVSLTGTVAYGTGRAAAAETVAGLTGARNVWNDIEIIYDIDPVDVDLHLQETLDRSALVPDGSDVKADTKDNVIANTISAPGSVAPRARRPPGRRLSAGGRPSEPVPSVSPVSSPLLDTENHN